MDIDTSKHFCDICNADVDVPADLLGGMAEAPRNLSRQFKEPRGTRPEGWSPPEVAAHLADIEVALGWRIRQVLAEDSPDLQPFNQDRWAQVLHYDTRELATSLATYSANRQSNLELLRALDEAGWQRTFQHGEFGRHLLRTLVYHIADHDLAHLRQVKGE